MKNVFGKHDLRNPRAANMNMNMAFNTTYTRTKVVFIMICYWLFYYKLLVKDKPYLNINRYRNIEISHRQTVGVLLN